jgi:Cu2+-exporting ATPase
MIDKLMATEVWFAVVVKTAQQPSVAWRELADHKPGIMSLISLAITVAFGTSLAATFGLFEIEVWWELASLITIMVLGHWLEMRAISNHRILLVCG